MTERLHYNQVYSIVRRIAQDGRGDQLGVEVGPMNGYCIFVQNFVDDLVQIVIQNVIHSIIRTARFHEICPRVCSGSATGIFVLSQ